MPTKAMLALVATMSLFLLIACGSDVTIYEAGVYKGKHDETATEEAAQRRQDQLRDRAMTGMTDR
ncbi:MAG: hypothetical protein JJT90_06240 [Ectothiorhodospiraceae bacterium]|nr:hypothetical protein [Ectothiorhodospiraceae bacterium]